MEVCLHSFLTWTMKWRLIVSLKLRNHYPYGINVLCTHWIKGWVDTTGGVDVTEKRKFWESNRNPSVLQPLVNWKFVGVLRHKLLVSLPVPHSFPQNGEVSGSRPSFATSTPLHWAILVHFSHEVEVETASGERLQMISENTQSVPTQRFSRKTLRKMRLERPRLRWVIAIPIQTCESAECIKLACVVCGCGCMGAGV